MDSMPTAIVSDLILKHGYHVVYKFADLNQLTGVIKLRNDKDSVTICHVYDNLDQLQKDMRQI